MFLAAAPILGLAKHVAVVIVLRNSPWVLQCTSTDIYFWGVRTCWVLYNAQIALPVITQSSNTDIHLLSIILYTFFF